MCAPYEALENSIARLIKQANHSFSLKNIILEFVSFGSGADVIIFSSFLRYFSSIHTWKQILILCLVRHFVLAFLVWNLLNILLYGLGSLDNLRQVHVSFIFYHLTLLTLLISISREIQNKKYLSSWLFRSLMPLFLVILILPAPVPFNNTLTLRCS